MFYTKTNKNKAKKLYIIFLEKSQIFSSFFLKSYILLIDQIKKIFQEEPTMKKTSIHSPFDFVIRPIHMDGFFDVDFADNILKNS